MEEAERFRLKAIEFSKEAEKASAPSYREHLLHMERSYRLLARNAEWLHRTTAYLRDERKRLWSSPRQMSAD